MRIVNLTKENVSLALCCESHGGYFEGGCEERKKFLLWKLEEGKVRGKIAVEDGEKLGWIDYYPREDGWFRIGCILIDLDKRGRGIGGALLNACLRDCRRSKGVLVDATIWEHMPKGFFKKFGFVDTAPQSNISVLAAKFKEEDVPAPQVQSKFTPILEKDKLVIDMFSDGQCPVSYVTKQLVKEAARDFRDRIVIREHDMRDEAEKKRFGNIEGIFLDGKGAFFGYPSKEYQGMIDEIREILRKRLEAKTVRYSFSIEKSGHV